MMHYFHPLIQFLEQHPGWGYCIAFTVAFAESLPLLGTIIPGSITMTALGTLIGSSILPGLTTILSAIAGAFAGDIVGYELGKKYHNRIRTVWPFKNHARWLLVGEIFFKKNGGKSIIIGRFIGPVRSTIPLIAGLLRMETGRFIAAALPAASLWALLYFIPGIILGSLAAELPPAVATKFTLIGFGIVIALWFLLWLIKISFRALSKIVNNLLQYCWEGLSFSNLGRRLISYIYNAAHPESHYPLSLLFGAFFSLLGFILLAEDVFQHHFLSSLNDPIFYFLQSIHTSHWTLFFALVTIFSDPYSLVVVAGILSFYFWRTKQYRSAVHLLLVVGMTGVALEIMRHVPAFYVPRPVGLMVVKPASAFPSGHTTFAVSVFGFFCYLIAERLKPNLRWLPYLLGGIIIFAAGFSRLYLGSHWFTDVIGGLLLGLCIFSITLVSYQHRVRLFANNRRTIQVIFLLLFASYLINVPCTLNKTLYAAEPLYPNYQITLQQWWKKPETYTPLSSLNRFGKPGLPFNVQWAAPINEVETTLKEHGWQPALKNSWRYNILRITQADPEYHLPLLKGLYNQRAPVLTFIQKIPGEKDILELRLWESTVDFTDTDLPLWVGTVDYRIPVKHLLSHQSDTRLTLKNKAAVDMLSKDLPPTVTQRKIAIPNGITILVIRSNLKSGVSS